MRIVGFDIGAQNMGMCVADVGEETIEAGTMQLREHTIIKIVHFHPNIYKETSYERRLEILYEFVDANVPADIDEFRIERQYINHNNPFAVNFVALGLSHILLGILKGKFPSATGRLVAPPVQTFRMRQKRKSKEISSYMIKNEIVRIGKELISHQSADVQNAVALSNDPTHMIEAMFIAISERAK